MDHDQARALKWLEENNPDAESDEESDSSSESDSDSDSDEEDEEAELLKELAKIKAERADEANRKRRAAAEQDKHELTQNAMSSNPLLMASNQTVQKKWYEDTVFRNQAKNLPKKKKRFINDTIRNDFHRKVSFFFFFFPTTKLIYLFSIVLG